MEICLIIIFYLFFSTGFHEVVISGNISSNIDKDEIQATQDEIASQNAVNFKISESGE